MELIFTTGGMIVGFIVGRIIERRNKIHGIVEVDHNTQQCIFRITSEELSNRKAKKVIFAINHDAEISREEQVL